MSGLNSANPDHRLAQAKQLNPDKPQSFFEELGFFRYYGFDAMTHSNMGIIKSMPQGEYSDSDVSRAS